MPRVFYKLALVITFMFGTTQINAIWAVVIAIMYVGSKIDDRLKSLK